MASTCFCQQLTSEWNVTFGTQRINWIIVYRPPYSETHPVTSSVFFTEFAQFLESAVLCTDHLVISGDFNIHMDVPDHSDAIKLRDLLETTGLVQHVTVPTHISMHTLDLIITRHSDRICVSPPWTDYLLSDHMPVYCQLRIEKLKPCFKRTKISYRKMKPIDIDAFKKDLSSSDLCNDLLTLELDDLVVRYNATLLSTVNSHAPLLTKIVTKRPTVPWFTTEVKAAKKECRKAERKWRRSKSPGDFLAYKAKKNQSTNVMKNARKAYFTNFIHENSHDQRKLFRSAKTLFDTKTDLLFQSYSDSNVLANDIGSFFTQKIERIRTEVDTALVEIAEPTRELLVPPPVPASQLESFRELCEEDVRNLIAKSSKKSCSLDPMPTPLVVECLDVLPVLTRMINLSLQSGQFPDIWKIADVHPGLKNSKLEITFTNLRPISNLAFTSM